MTRLSHSSWFSQLVWVLLGIRASAKEDIGSSAAEVVYAGTLSIPGEFVAQATHKNEFLRQLCKTASSFWATPTTAHTTPTHRVPDNLHQVEFVFIRCDAHKPPLTPPLKTFHKFSVDRLKPAIVETELEPAARPRRDRPHKATPLELMSAGGGGSVADPPSTCALALTNSDSTVQPTHAHASWLVV